MTDNNIPQNDDSNEEDFRFDSEESDFNDNIENENNTENTNANSTDTDFESIAEETANTERKFEGVFDDFTPINENTAEKQSEIKKQPRQKKIIGFLKKIQKPIIIACAILLPSVIFVFSYAYFSITPDRIMNNMFIEDLNVSGFTYQEAVDAINSACLFENTDITLINGDNSYIIHGNDIGLTPIPEETAQKAIDYCATDNFFINGIRAASLLFKKHTIIPAPQLNTEKLDEKISEFGNTILGERKQHYIEFGDDGFVTVYSGQTGYNGDPSGTREEILNALKNEHFNRIPVNYTSAPPDEMTLAAFDALVYKDPTDAKYEVNSNEVSIVPSESGRYINKEESAPFLLNVYEGCEPVKIPYYISEPEITADALNDKLFNATLSTYSTSYAGSPSNRCANVARAASLIDGTVIAPGDTFSFNDTVGHRTTENGFLTAKEYIAGKSVDGIGGGTCQVSSTLYSAVLYADMKIVERLNHMMTVGYIPLGQDATVSDGGVDFKFSNNSNHPVKISAKTGGASITISIIGTAWEPPREVKITNSTSKSGANTVVRSTRYVYSNGELISTDTLNSSTYMPHSTDAPSNN